MDLSNLSTKNEALSTESLAIFSLVSSRRRLDILAALRRVQPATPSDIANECNSTTTMNAVYGMIGLPVQAGLIKREETDKPVPWTCKYKYSWTPRLEELLRDAADRRHDGAGLLRRLGLLKDAFDIQKPCPEELRKFCEAKRTWIMTFGQFVKTAPKLDSRPLPIVILTYLLFNEGKATKEAIRFALGRQAKYCSEILSEMRKRFKVISRTGLTYRLDPEFGRVIWILQ